MKKKSLNNKNESERGLEKDNVKEMEDRELMKFINKRKEENSALKKILEGLNTEKKNKNI